MHRFQRSVPDNARGLLPRSSGRAAVALAFLTGSVTAGSLAAGSPAADEPTTNELMEQITQLQEQVRQMKSEAARVQGENENEDDAVARVLDDAERRSGKPVLMQKSDPDPFTAGHDGRFVLRSPDGLFELNPNFQLQARFVGNFNTEGGSTFDERTDGFEIRRAKIGFKGHAFTEDLTYDLKFAFDRDGGGAVLENAFVDYTPLTLLPRDNFGRGDHAFGVRLGQYKDVTFHEESTSSSKLLTVDRSLVNELIGGGQTDFIQGAGLLWKGDQYKGLLAFTDGANSDNTNFNNGNAFGVAGRLDAMVMGDENAMDDFTALGTAQNSARVGAGFHYTGDGSARAIHHSVDGQYETDAGFGFFASFYGLHAEDGDLDTYNWGAMAQASQLIGDSGWEIFGRYDFILLDDDIVLGTDAEDFFHEVTAGVNKYWEGHKVKMTLDVVFLPNGTPDGVSGIGIVDSVGEFDEQLAIRGQFQLLL